MKLIASSVLVLFLSASVARADDPPDPPHRLSPTIATTYTFGMTAGTIGLATAGLYLKSPTMVGIGIAGLAIAPAAGPWYAQHRGGFGILVRTAAITSMIVGAARALPSCWDEVCRLRDFAVPLVIGGAALWTGSVIYDGVAAARIARRWNREHFAIAPTAVSTGGAPAPGIALGFSF